MYKISFITSPLHHQKVGISSHGPTHSHSIVELWIYVHFTHMYMYMISAELRHVHTGMYQISHYITITSSKVGISSQGPTYVIPLLSCEQVPTKPTTPCCYLIFSVNGSSLDELQYCWIWYGKCHSNLNLPRPDIDSQQGGVSLSLIWTWNGKHLIELCFTP